MGHRFADLAFTPGVRALQESLGSRAHYARAEGTPTSHERLTAAERDFIAARDSFYMASVGEGGWPYVQHRGGPAGFLKVLDDRRIGFSDYRGNRQYISLGNLVHDDRVALILVDYPARRRLKILGNARIVDVSDGAAIASLASPGYPAKVERGLIIEVAAFDWNCPQHITPRYTAAEVDAVLVAQQARIDALEQALAACATAPPQGG